MYAKSVDEALEQVRKEYYDRFRFRILKAKDGETEAELEILETDRNGLGVPYGGVLFNMMDLLSGAAIISSGSIGPTISGSVDFVNGLRSDQSLIRCRAQVMEKNGDIGYTDAEITDDEGRIIARAGFTFYTSQRLIKNTD